MHESGLNSILDRLAPLRRRNVRFLFALFLVIAALALAATAQFVFRPGAALVFAVAVIVSTGLFGLAAGLTSALLSFLAIDFFFVPPGFAFVTTAAVLWLAFDLGVLAIGTHLLVRYISGRIRSKVKPPLGIHGQLDGIQNGEVYGWAMDCDNPLNPVTVTILADERPIAQVAAVHYRPDVESALHCSGRYGFYADVSQWVTAEEESSIEARLPNGRALENSPQTLTIPARPRKPGAAVLFMHIPKTAGIAFREAIAANYRESQIAYLYATPPGYLVDDLRRLPLEQRRDLRFVAGHFQYGVHHALPQDALYFTIVREPAARLLSHYAFLQHTAPELVKSGGRLLSLEELLQRKPNIHFDNPLVRHFGSVDEREFPPGSIDRPLYEKALYYLRNGFLFVGHQEYSADAFQWLRQRFGWQARAELELVNVGLRRMNDADRASTRKAMEIQNQWDCLLYEEILKLFPYNFAG
ncbi:MAG: DUF4118 domain-containing protein [Acidobacteriaceae bacterium]|nr:DUF4118 domain-containing protein [Acidobacteriaceae bacterium]